MYNHDGTWDFLKLVAILGFIVLSVWWLQTTIGGDYTVLIIFALVGVIIFGAGAMLAHMNQKMTLDAITKFNANDARIDAGRMQAFKEMQRGQSALDKAAAQLTVLDAKRITGMADQRAKLLTDAARSQWSAQQRQEQPAQDLWDMDDDDEAGDDFKEWN